MPPAVLIRWTIVTRDTCQVGPILSRAGRRVQKLAAVSSGFARGKVRKAPTSQKAKENKTH